MISHVLYQSCFRCGVLLCTGWTFWAAVTLFFLQLRWWRSVMPARARVLLRMPGLRDLTLRGRWWLRLCCYHGRCPSFRLQQLWPSRRLCSATITYSRKKSWQRQESLFYSQHFIHSNFVDLFICSITSQNSKTLSVSRCTWWRTLKKVTRCHPRWTQSTSSAWRRCSSCSRCHCHYFGLHFLPMHS